MKEDEFKTLTDMYVEYFENISSKPIDIKNEIEKDFVNIFDLEEIRKLVSKVQFIIDQKRSIIYESV